MAEINPPSWLQARTDHKAQQYRRMLGSLMYDRGGVVQNLDLQVTQNGTPNMSVNVATGRVFVPGTLGTYQGLYHCDNQGVVNKSISAAHATNPRYDRVYAIVEDAEYAGGTNAWSIQVATGTPAASPTEPTLPSNSFELARITVGAAVTSITNANILDRRLSAGKGRAAALGGVTTTLSGALPTANLTEGMFALETDTNYLKVYNGTAWVGAGAYTALAPHFATGSVTNLTTTGSNVLVVDSYNLFVAPYPLTMHVIASGDQGGNAAANEAQWLIVGQQGNTFITKGPGINADFITVKNTSTADAKSWTVQGWQTYSAGQTVGYQLYVKLNTSNLYAGAAITTLFYPKVS